MKRKYKRIGFIERIKNSICRALMVQGAMAVVYELYLLYKYVHMTDFKWYLVKLLWKGWCAS